MIGLMRGIYNANLSHSFVFSNNHSATRTKVIRFYPPGCPLPLRTTMQGGRQGSVTGGATLGGQSFGVSAV